jgi:hypothetical protein
MLRIIIEVVPNGDELKKHPIGIAEISNVGGDEQRADYEYKLWHKRKATGEWDEHTGSIIGYDRANGAWRLARAVISRVFGEP